MPWFLKNLLKTLLSQRKVVKPCNNVKIPPFSSGHWNRCHPRALDGIFSRVPRKKAEFWPRLGYIKVTHAGFTVTDSILVLNVVTSKSCPSSHRPLSYFYLTYILPPSYFYQTCILSISLLTKFGVFPPLRGVTTVFKECRPIKFILIERR